VASMAVYFTMSGNFVISCHEVLRKFIYFSCRRGERRDFLSFEAAFKLVLVLLARHKSKILKTLVEKPRVLEANNEKCRVLNQKAKSVLFYTQ
jgi:hypothetical protein